MSEWISVEERLPQLYIQILGALQSTSGKYSINRINRVNADDYDWEQDGFEVANCWNVTHWMPLPEPPE